MGSTELARTVTLLAVEALERSRMKAGRSGAGAAAGAASLTVESEACEAWALVLGEGFEDAGVSRGMGDE